MLPYCIIRDDCDEMSVCKFTHEIEFRYDERYIYHYYDYFTLIRKKKWWKPTQPPIHVQHAHIRDTFIFMWRVNMSCQNENVRAYMQELQCTGLAVIRGAKGVSTRSWQMVVCRKISKRLSTIDVGVLLFVFDA